MNAAKLISVWIFLVLTAAGAAQKGGPLPSEPWSVKPDPAVAPVVDKPQAPTGTVGLGPGFSPVFYPTYSSSFACVVPDLRGQKGGGDMLQVYDLRTLHPVGPAVSEPVDFGGTHVLSPDGTYVACRAKGYHSSIAVVNARTGQALAPIEVDPEPKRFALPVDFAGKSRLLTMCHISLFPEGGEQ